MPGSTSCSATGLLNQVLLALGIVDEPLVWLATDTAIYHRHRLFLPAVHGAAALREPGEDGRDAARGRRRSRLPAAGRRSGWSPCRCRCPASSPARCCASSRSSASSSSPICSAARETLMIGQTLWTEFFTNRTGRSPPRSRSCCWCCWWADRRLPATARRASWSADDDAMRRFSLVQHRRARARAGVPLPADRRSWSIYSFNASRLVTVWGGWSLRWYATLLQRPRHARRGLDQPAHRRRLGHGRDRARHAGGARAGPRAAASAAALLFSGMIYAPLVMPEVITGLSLLLLFVARRSSTAASGP